VNRPAPLVALIVVLLLTTGLFAESASEKRPQPLEQPEPEAATEITPRPAAEPKVEPPPVGITARITQERASGSKSEWRAHFLPSGKFRVEGKKHLLQAKREIKMVIAGNGKLVRVLAEMPEGPVAATVDLKRIRKVIPHYSPASIYDPTVYQKIVTDAPRKRTLGGAKLDGVSTAGYELALPAGRHSLPVDLPLDAPEPARVRVWICPADGSARKVEFEDAQGKVFMRTSYMEVKTGVPMDDKLFELQFPEGVQPTDNTGFILACVTATRAPDERKSEDKAPGDQASHPQDGRGGI